MIINYCIRLYQKTFDDCLIITVPPTLKNKIQMYFDLCSMPCKDTNDVKNIYLSFMHINLAQCMGT